MALTTQLLSFNIKTSNLSRQSNSNNLENIIKMSNEHQIKQHQIRTHRSPQKKLIETTKKILLPNTHNTITQCNAASRSFDNRGATSFRSRRSSKVESFKRQFELMNEIRNTIESSKIRRYRQQIMLEEAEFQATITHHRIKRNVMSSTRGKPRIKRQAMRTPQLCFSSQHQRGSISTRQNNDAEEDLSYDRIFPHRSYSIQRKKTKGNVQPWHVSYNLI